MNHRCTHVYRVKNAMKTFISFTSLFLLTACATHSQKKDMPQKDPAPVSAECSRHYLFDGTYYDLETCKQADIGGKVIDFKKCSPFGYQFTSHIDDTIHFRNKTFCVNPKTYRLLISGEKAKTITVKMPLADPQPEEVSQFHYSLLATNDGVVVIIENYYGTTFTIAKYDENGKELAKTELEHTFVTHPEPNTNHHHRYLYLGYTTPTQLVFTSHMAFGEKDKTIVVELKNLAKKEYDFKISGIVLDETQQHVSGLTFHEKDQFTIRFPESGKEISFTIPNGDGACETILWNNQLIVANYHPISTGSSLYSFDAATGKQLWKADVGQVNASHSEYYNKVYLSRYKNTIIMEGAEAYGKYLQFFDAGSGKRLGCYGILGIND